MDKKQAPTIRSLISAVYTDMGLKQRDGRRYPCKSKLKESGSSHALIRQDILEPKMVTRDKEGY